MKEIITSLCLLALAGTLKAQNDVSNIRVQVADELLIVTYDLAVQADIEAYVSFDDRKTWRGPLKHVTGAIGKGTTHGKDKIFLWDVVKEIGYVDETAIIKIVSERGGNGSSSSGENLTFTVNGVTFEMVYVQGGSFTMGCTDEQGNDCSDNEKPPHSVNLQDFYIGKFEVIQALWLAVMPKNPSYHKGDNLPVENVNWNDCIEFIRRLNKLTGKTFSIPTEAQWEYAARGGAKSKGYVYSGGNDIDDVAWYRKNSGRRTQEVGNMQPNELGIYDMSGNVWEWCDNWYDYYVKSSKEGNMRFQKHRVCRGGSFADIQRRCRVTQRYPYRPDHDGRRIGFRLVMK